MSKFISLIEDTIFKRLQELFHSPSDYLNNVTTSIVLITLGILFHRIIVFVVHKTKLSVLMKATIIRYSRNIVTIFVFTLVIIDWIDALDAFVLIITVLVIFMVVVVKGVLNNIIAWFIITNQRYFKIGDRVEVNGVIGKVVDLGLFHFKLVELKGWLSSESDTGRIVSFPNHVILESPIINYTETGFFTRQELSYPLSFESDWEAAREILMSVVTEQHQALYPNDELEQPSVSLTVNEKGLVVGVKFLVDYRQSTKVKTLINEKVLASFKANPNIQFMMIDIRTTNFPS